MKLAWPLALFWGLAIVYANWLPEDYEIFSLNDKIREDLGKEATFYSWLKLEKGSKSSWEEINKAYRKLSRKIHPDKYSKSSRSEKKKAEERFQRLSLIGNILRDHGLKSRYDYYLNHGFPKWSKTGYFYARFKPGFLFSVIIVYLLVCTFQYVSLKISRKQDFKRIVDLKEQIKLQAWGGSFIPPLDGSARKVSGPNGNQFLVSPIGEVSLIGEDEHGAMTSDVLDEFDININPGLRESYFLCIPCGLWNVTLGRIINKRIELDPGYVNTRREATTKDEPKPKKKAKIRKGEKIELPNGKVIYSRKK